MVWCGIRSALGVVITVLDSHILGVNLETKNQFTLCCNLQGHSLAPAGSVRRGGSGAARANHGVVVLASLDRSRSAGRVCVSDLSPLSSLPIALLSPLSTHRSRCILSAVRASSINWLIYNLLACSSWRRAS